MNPHHKNLILEKKKKLYFPLTINFHSDNILKASLRRPHNRKDHITWTFNRQKIVLERYESGRSISHILSNFFSNPKSFQIFFLSHLHIFSLLSMFIGFYQNVYHILDYIKNIQDLLVNLEKGKNFKFTLLIMD